MYYDINIYSDNPVIRTLRDIRSGISWDDPIGGRSFRLTGARDGFGLVVNGLLYYNNISCILQQNHIGRNDWLPQYVVDLPRRYNSTEYKEGLVKEYATLTLCHVKGQITDFFENALRNNTPIYNIDNEEDNPYSEQTWEELNGLSIALKCSPKHRVRAYKYRIVEKRNNAVRTHYIIYSAKSFDEDDCLLRRKCYAALPYLLSFEEDDALTPVLRALEHSNSDDWLTLAETYLNNVPAYINYKRERLIKSFETLNAMHSESLNARAKEMARRVEEALKAYQTKLHEQQLVLNEIAGVCDETLTIDDINMLIDKNIIQDLTIDRQVITFTVTSPVLAYDKPAAEKYYKTLIKNNAPQEYRDLIKHVFVDEDYILYFTDRVKIDFATYEFNARNSVYAPNGYIFRNPHHKHYNCWGGYGDAITRLISQYNYMQLFMQIKAGVGSINMTDYTVLGRFQQDILELYNRGVDAPKVIALREDPKKLYTFKEMYDLWNPKSDTQTTTTTTVAF